MNDSDNKKIFDTTSNDFDLKVSDLKPNTQPSSIDTSAYIAERIAHIKAQEKEAKPVTARDAVEHKKSAEIKAEHKPQISVVRVSLQNTTSEEQLTTLGVQSEAGETGAVLTVKEIGSEDSSKQQNEIQSKVENRNTDANAVQNQKDKEQEQEQVKEKNKTKKARLEAKAQAKALQAEKEKLKLQRALQKREEAIERYNQRMDDLEKNGKGFGAFVLLNHSSIPVLVFCLVLFFGFFANIFHASNEYSILEKRPLQQFPSISLHSLKSGQFMREFNDFANDQFVNRQWFLGINTAMLKAEQRHDNQHVYFAKDNYFIKKNNPFDMTQARKNIRRLSNIKTASLSSESTPRNFYFMLAPTASEILSAYLPAKYPAVNQASFINEVTEAMGNFAVINCYGLLKEVGAPAYFRNDHHWTTLGAFQAAKAFLQAKGHTVPNENEFDKTKVATNFLGTTYAQTGSFSYQPDIVEIWEYHGDHINNNVRVYDGSNKLVQVGLYNREWLFSNDSYSVYLGGRQNDLIIDTGIENGKQLAIFKDSYANSMLPFLTSYYEKIYLIDPRGSKYSMRSLIAEYPSINDVLILYNVDSFLTDTSIYKIAK